jgi:hypothetical protein
MTAAANSTPTPVSSNQPAWNGHILTSTGKAELEIAENLYGRKDDLKNFYREPKEVVQIAARFSESYPLSADKTSMAYDQYEFDYTPLAIKNVYSDEKVARFRELLKSLTRQFVPEDSILAVPEEIIHLPELAKDPKLFQGLLFLWPLALTESKVKIFQRTYLLEKADSLSPEDLDRIYTTDWKEVILPQMKPILTDPRGARFWGKWINWVKDNYYSALALPAFEVETKVDKLAEIHHMRVAYTPALIALFRGQWGLDCSLWSVPLYALSSGARVYSIWLHDTTEPDGYVFVVEAKVNGRTVPYILTINGIKDFDFAVTRAVVSAVAKIYNTNEVVVPAFLKGASRIVNTTVIRSGLQFAKSDFVDVELPSDWETISRFTKVNHTYGKFVDTYSEGALKKARLVNLSKQEHMGEMNLSLASKSSLVFTRPNADLVTKLESFRRIEALAKYQHEYSFSAIDEVYEDYHNFESHQPDLSWRPAPDDLDRVQFDAAAFTQRIEQAATSGAQTEIKNLIGTFKHDRPGTPLATAAEQAKVFAEVLPAFVQSMSIFKATIIGGNTETKPIIDGFSNENRKILTHLWNDGHPRISTLKEYTNSCVDIMTK